MSPHGGGILYVSDKMLELLSPDEVTMSNVTDRSLFPVLDYTLIESADKLQPMPINIAQLASMSAALDIILELGIENIGRYLNDLAKYLVDSLKNIGIDTKLASDDSKLKHIVCFDEERNRELAEFAKGKNVFISPRRTGIRMGFHIYNNKDDVDRAVEVIKEFYDNN
jgi:selenocysteine lyase/cysteine desulfurase